MKVGLFSTFWICYVVKTFTGFLLLLFYLTDIDLVFLFKVPLAMSLVAAVLFALKNMRLAQPFVIVGMICLVYGAIVGGINGNRNLGAVMTHIYSLVMAVSATTMGYWHGWDFSPARDRFLDRIIGMVFVVTFATMLTYYYFYYIAGRIAYFGFDTELPLVAAFALGRGNTLQYCLIVGLILFSGKRGPMISVLLPAIFVYLRSAWSSWKGVWLAALVFGLLLGAGTYAYKQGLLSRFEEVARVDFSDEDQFYLSTSGRSMELIGLFRHLNEKPSRWWIGSGIGAQYRIVGGLGENLYDQDQHYLHISLLTFVLVYGVPVTVLLCSFFVYVVVSNWRRYKSKYFIAFLVTFIGGMFGATMVVEPVFWFFLGVNLSMASRCRAPTPVPTGNVGTLSDEGLRA